MTLQEKINNISNNFLTSKTGLKVTNISSGFPNLDQAINLSGIPSKSIIEIFGEKATGKTLLSYNFISNAQKANKLCVYVNAEKSFDKQTASRQGVNIDDLLIISNNESEQVFDLILTLLEREKVSLIVFDSVTAINNINNNIYNTICSMIEKLIQYVVDKEVMLVFTSQVREDLQRNRQTDTFHKLFVKCANVRMKLERKETVREKSQVVGIKSNINIIKNKFQTLPENPVSIMLRF